MSDVVSGDDWVADAPAETREAMASSVAAAREAEARPRHLEPREVRRTDDWMVVLDTQPISAEAIARSSALEVVDGELRLKVRCYGCKVWSALPVPDRKLSPIAVKIAQRWLCEPCSAKDDEAAARTRTLEGLQARLKASGMPAALAREVSWDSMIGKAGTPDEQLRREHAIARARAWSAEARPARGLLLWGAPGTGKTRLAATAAVARLAHSPLKWVSVGVLMAELAGAWNDDDRKAALKVLTSTVPVVLDDFDKINPTEGARAQLFTALDKREQSKAPVIVTTNLKPAELEKKLGEVIVSRLMGMCEVLPFPGPDRRLELDR